VTVDKEGHNVERWDITPGEAQLIMRVSNAYDMPKIMKTALSFALFQTYAIPSISKLLYATKELGSEERVAKRYADTEILIATFVHCPLSGFHDLAAQPDGRTPAEDSRGSLALARMNWLHARYNISNDDYLFTLSLFVIEPITWARRYGWRPLSPLECQAYFVVWSEIARRMDIKDVPGTLDGLIAWSKAYADAKMVPAKTNHLVATLTTQELVAAVPAALGLRDFVARLTICVLDEQTRVAMMQPEQPTYMHAMVGAALRAAAFAQRHLCLPRAAPCTAIHIAPPTTNAETLRPREFRSRPWYKAEATGLAYLGNRLLVAAGYYADMPAPKYRSEGYVLERCGPMAFESEGNEETRKMAEKLQGCPIKGVF